MNTIKFSQLSTLPQNDKENSYFFNGSLIIGITDETALVSTLNTNEKGVYASNNKDIIELSDNTELTVIPKVNEIDIALIKEGDFISLLSNIKEVKEIKEHPSDFNKNYTVVFTDGQEIEVTLMAQFYVFKEQPETQIESTNPLDNEVIVVDEPIDYSKKQFITIEQAYEVQQDNPEIVITDTDNSKITIIKDEEYDCYEYVNEEGVTTICDENEYVMASYRELYEMIANKIKDKLPKQTHKLEETANRIATHHYLFTQRLDLVS